MTSNSTSATKGRAWFSGSETRPSLLVYYRCTNGLENYYTYQTAGAGNAGISYISDYTGQLTQAIPIVSYASAVNPFSLTMYYNSSYSLYHGDTAYDVGGQQNLAMVLGAGVGMNIMQCMTTVEVENSTASSGKTTCLRLTDGDGTWHYFAEDSRRQSGYYYDEDGLGLKVYPYAANCYKVYEDDGSNTTDTGDYRMLFVNGHLRELRDQNGNILRINYKNGDPTLTGDRITSVTQINSGCSAITVATFAYYSDVGTLKSITDAAGFRYQFSYVNNNGTLLESIARNETTIARYTYSGKRMTSAYDAERQQGIAFTYADGKLSGYREYDGSNQTGTEISVSYPGSGQTCYSDRNGVCTIYSFDYAGRTVNACTKNASGKVLGASNAVYSGIGTTDQTNNRTLRTASIGVAAMNELRDHGFESASSDWTLSGTSADGSTNTNIVIRAMTGSGELVRAGTSACKGWVTAGSGATVSVKRSTNRLYRNKTYTFSAYVNTSKCSSFSGSGICLRLENSSGTSLASSEPLNYKTDSAIDGGWVRLSFTYTPTASGNYVLALYDHGAGPYFYTDDWQVEASETPSNLNLLENGNLQHWGHGWSVNAAEFYAGEGLNAVSEDAYSIRIQGDAYTNAYAYQDVPINQTGGSYVLSGWAKANAVPDNVQTATGDDAAARDTNKQFGLRAVVTYADSTTEYHYAPFCADVKAWQFTSLAIVPKQADKKVDSIRVICAYEKNDNTALFDELSLTREAAQSMTYDENGNLVSVKSTGTADETAAYENGNLISVKTGGSGTFTYEYDDNNNVTGTSNGVIRQDYTRNAQGAVTETKLTADSGSGSAISAQTAYTGGSNLVSSQTDSRGNAVTYSYPESIYKMLGVPYNTTDANGTTRRTIYDTTTGRFSMTYIPSVISIANTYNSKGQVSTITRAGYYDGSRVTQEYGMTYDSFGNTTGISVGSRTLSACEYEENNGNLAKQTYGNGAYTQFQYDELDRISRAITSDGDTYSYSYTGDGQLYQINDTAGGLAYQYTYDTIGRLVGTSQIGGSVGLRASYGYDDANRLTKFAYSIPGVVDSAEESFYYNESSTDSISDGTLTGMALLSNEWIYYRYDSLSRLSERDVAGILTEHQTYLAGTSGNTTTLPETFYTTAKGGTAKLSGFQYGYDALGNITKITDLTDHSYTQYTYDQQGQVTSAKAYNASGTLQKEETYTYDSYGNLRSSSSPEGNHTYTYGDSDWRDLLTAYDGVSITYDGSGNPLTYYNGKNYTMTWRNGRELNTVTTGGKTYSYEYDVNGLRTRKTNADGGYTEYYIVDGLAVAERRFYSGGAEFYTMRYYFDESNSPVGFGIQYASEASTYWDNYYFAKNGQGDVISLYHSVYNSGSASYSGTLVATYKYDTWGKPLGIYNASGNEISQSGSNVAALNPFRYRGYRYDADTGFYYLQRRYYDPEIGRFINADDTGYIGTNNELLSYNLFSYCLNNPINQTDSGGNWSLPNWAKVAIGTVAFAGAIALTVATGGGAAAVAVGVAKVVGSVALSTAVSAGAGYLENGKQGAIDGACNGFMFGSLSACGGAALKYVKVRAATTGSPNSIGKVGERLAGIDQSAKQPINVNGRVRIPDALTPDSLIEVKNVKYISNTLQLRDFADYAYKTSRSLELYVRPTTKVAQTVIEAGWNIHYLW